MITAAVRRWMIALFFTTLIFATRLPFAPHQLVTFDDLNLEYPIGHFNISASHPGPRSEAAGRTEARAGEQIVWYTEFCSIVQREFTPRAAGSVLSTDLPLEHGSRPLGEYELQW